jgi:hypothetical protein
MKSYNLKKYLRQNKSGKNGKPGTWCIRLLFNADKCRNPIRVEIGLGTSCEAEAIERAAIFLRGVYALGGSFSNKISVSSFQAPPVSLLEALQKEKKRKPKRLEELPLFRFSACILPPKANLENSSSCS